MKSTQQIEQIIKTLAKTNKISMLGSFSGETPFYVLISTVLSQRNRDEMTRIVVKRLFSKYKNVHQMAKAPIKDIEKRIKQSGFYHTKAKRIKEISKILIEKYKGKVPDNEEELLKLPGVGRKTAGCVLVYAYGKQAIPVDTHVNRLSNRLGLVKTNIPEKTEQELRKIVPKRLWKYVNEVLVIHGQTICRPINPKCNECSITKYCDYYNNFYKIK